MKYDSILETIGRTPLVRLGRMTGGDSAEVYVKLESANPMRSVKDRIALAMIEQAERDGRLRPGMDIMLVEPTSGNTGIGLAMVCAVKGYKLTLTMPESMSLERRRLLKAMGAELILTPKAGGMRGAVECAEGICRDRPNTFMPQQFNNPANPQVHYLTTGAEILQDLPDLDAFVAGVGTGGTLTGVGSRLRESGSTALLVAVEPAASPVLSGGKPGPHTIQGIGAGFVPGVLDAGLIDRIVQVKDEDAKETARQMAGMEGMFVGPSSGAAVWAALKVAKELGAGKKVVVVAPDFGERYLSTDVFPE
ncbi:cysteine synthase [Methanomassiliicoccales archaeon RumEn M1]|jgi:cysteine synthase A|nr:cysteine synthase [Methanomassiliicoccales archaeon RumEn M1]